MLGTINVVIYSIGGKLIQNTNIFIYTWRPDEKKLKKHLIVLLDFINKKAIFNELVAPNFQKLETRHESHQSLECNESKKLRNT